MEALDGDPKVVLAYPRVSEIDENGKELDPSFDPLDLSSPSAARRLHHLIWYLREVHMVFGLARSEVLAQTDLLLPEQGSDRLLLAELALLGPWHQVDEMLFANRRAETERSGRDRRFLDPSLRTSCLLQEGLAKVQSNAEGPRVSAARPPEGLPIS